MYQLDYNWGISLPTCSNVLNKMSESNTEIMLITSGLARNNNMFIDTSTLKEWENNSKLNQIGKLLISEWRNTISFNSLNKVHNLNKELTCFLALNNFKGVSCYTEINDSVVGSYLTLTNTVTLTKTKTFLSNNVHIINEFNNTKAMFDIMKGVERMIFTTS